MRKVVFLGNCQAASLAEVYTEHVAPGTGDYVSFVASTSPVSEADVAKVAAADLIVEQVFDFKQYLAAEDLGAGERTVRFPTVSGAFLWPFTGGMPPAKALKLWPEGTYFGPDLNDRFLNKMLDEGADPDDAVARYLALDAEAMNLDKRFDFALRCQRRRDAVAGSRIADAIAAHYRDEPLFFSPFHPGARIFGLLMADILKKTGADNETIFRMGQALTRSPLDVTSLPIHPTVARHFGLAYIADHQRYPSLDGRFTFAEWAERYMRLEWNRWLAKGAALHYHPETALENLQIGLLYSPRSARGYHLLAEQLYRQNRFEYAAAALRRAIALDPDEPRFQAAFGHALAAMRDFAAAAEAFRQALAFNPNNPGLNSSLSHALCALGQFEEAIPPARAALDLDPARRAWDGHLANVYALAARPAEAELAYREALALEPANATIHARFAGWLTTQGRQDEAVAAMRGAVMLDRKNPLLSAEFAQMLFLQETAGGASGREARGYDTQSDTDHAALPGGVAEPVAAVEPEFAIELDMGASELWPNEPAEAEPALLAPANDQPWPAAARLVEAAD